MYTQCPKCLTYFQVSADHLKVAQGNVRCGQCRNVFSALGNLTELPPQPNSQEKHTESNTDNNSSQPIQQDNLSDAIAAIQALNQSSEKLHILSENKPHYAHPLDNDALITHDSASHTGGNHSTARKLLQPASVDTHENIPELITDEEPEELINDFNFDEALKAVDEIGINNEVIDIPDDNPVHYSISDDEEITPTIDGSHLVEDYTSSSNEPYIGAPQEETLFFTETDRQKQAPATPDTVQNTTEHEEIFIAITPDDKIGKKTKAVNKTSTNEPIEAVIKKTTLPDTEDLTKPANAPKRDKKTKHNPAEQIKNLPAIPKQLIDDFRQDHPMLITNYRSIATWGTGSLLLMFLFLGQSIYFKHDELGQVSQLRPWIEFFCRHTNCELSLQADITQLELLGQDIRSHPTTNNALLVSATIINNAPYIQPYPGLQLNFSDINGEEVAVRNFGPKDYAATGINVNKGMEPNTPIQIELEIIDPGKNAINFEFNFFSL
ncbi:MAG: DUF3426 domain-containing protein [Gammaproteobacteria bacterium]|nr:DUF3426 domain-containing protein [Gammaproteobacteria bacterium]